MQDQKITTLSKEAEHPVRICGRKDLDRFAQDSVHRRPSRTAP
jgi:hypothetical protein